MSNTGRSSTGFAADRKGEGSVSGRLGNVRFLTVAEVAEVMRVSKMTVYRLVHSGELPAVRFGRSFRVPESAVLDVASNFAQFRDSEIA